jgi:hypothetical protein
MSVFKKESAKIQVQQEIKGKRIGLQCCEIGFPLTYHVVTKGRILSFDGVAGPQIDILVLRPVYPRHLMDKKLYLAGGVAAAFECKLTLKPEHIKKAVENALSISSTLYLSV